MMLSESQERMLLILNDGKEESARKIFTKWGLDFSVIGKTTDTKNLVLTYNDKEVANLPLSSLSTDAPLYDRKWKKSLETKKITLPKDFQSKNLSESLKKIFIKSK